jgi:hypothetical protein
MVTTMAGHWSQSSITIYLLQVRFCKQLERQMLLRAGNPASSNLSTWSFISEMSGDTTTVVPGKCKDDN